MLAGSLKNINTTVQDLKKFDVDENTLENEKERALAIAILKLPDALDSLVQELLPSRLCDYAYNLCVSFNEFYSCCKVSYRMICETQTSFFLSNKGQV